MNILIIDVGNSKTKCYVFDVEPRRKYADTCQIVYENSVPTPREDPNDLIETVRDLIQSMKSCAPPIDVGMITAFGDAFIHYRHGEHPYYVFADEAADPGIPYAYSISGFPMDIQLSSIRALKAKHNASWADMFSPNGWVANQLTENPDKNPKNAWDLTQASISGIYNLFKDQWIHTGFTAPPPTPIPSQTIIGHIDEIPFLAGGLDNAFVDTDDTDPYIVAGTWLVLGRAFSKYDASEFTSDRRKTVRWLISGNGNYHAQIVRRVSNPITESETARILDDLAMLGVSSYIDEKQRFSQRVQPRVKVFGGYGEELAISLQDMTYNLRFSTVGPSERTDLYQHQMSALYVHNHWSQK